jgi:hypothetical protein
MSRRNRKFGRRTGSKYVLPQVGTTEDGKKVLAGVYEFHETYGMPLSALFSWLADHDMVPDWIDFYQWAEKNGMKHNKIMAKLRDPLEDAWGPEFADIVCNYLIFWKASQIKE